MCRTSVSVFQADDFDDHLFNGIISQNSRWKCHGAIVTNREWLKNSAALEAQK